MPLDGQQFCIFLHKGFKPQQWPGPYCRDQAKVQTKSTQSENKILFQDLTWLQITLTASNNTKHGNATKPGFKACT